MSRKIQEYTCPLCGFILEKAGKSGYECPNPDCKVIRVVFNRAGGVKSIVRETI